MSNKKSSKTAALPADKVKLNFFSPKAGERLSDEAPFPPTSPFI